MLRLAREAITSSMHRYEDAKTAKKAVDGHAKKTALLPR